MQNAICKYVGFRYADCMHFIQKKFLGVSLLIRKCYELGLLTNSSQEKMQLWCE